MTTKRSHKVFVNLPVKDLKRSTAFFTTLGFTFNPQFSDENGACMVLSDEGYVMLLTEGRFKDFVVRPIADAAKTTGGIFALSVESRADVDAMCNRALEIGGSAAAPALDHGFMYVRSFFDPDGHHWEVFWMDPAAVQR